MKAKKTTKKATKKPAKTYNDGYNDGYQMGYAMGSPVTAPHDWHGKLYHGATVDGIECSVHYTGVTTKPATNDDLLAKLNDVSKRLDTIEALLKEKDKKPIDAKLRVGDKVELVNGYASLSLLASPFYVDKVSWGLVCVRYGSSLQATTWYPRWAIKKI